MATYPVVSGVPQGLPPIYDELVIEGANCRVLEPSEYYDDTPASWPRSSITKILQANRTLTGAYFGMHAVGDPPAGMTFGVMRSHDHAFNGQSCRWHAIETSAGVYNWASMDDWVAKNSGKDLIYVIGFAPAFHVTSPTTGPYGNGTAQMPDTTAWSNFCTALATRYSSVIKNWEIWNEVNTTNFWVGTQANLATLMRLARTAIRAVDPTANILSPSIVGIEAAGATNYLAGIFSASDGAAGTGKDHVDKVSVHLYPNADITRSLAQMMTSVRAVMTTAGISSKPIVCTEVGLINPNYGVMTREIRVRMMSRIMAMAAGLGCESCAWYGAGYGVLDIVQDAAEWNELAAYLTSGEMTACNLMYDGRVALKVGGRVRLI